MSSKQDASDKGLSEDHDRKVKRSKMSNDDDEDDATMASSGSSLDEDESTTVVPPHQELVFLDNGKPVYANDIPVLREKTMGGDDIQDVAICDKYIAVLRTSGEIQFASHSTFFGSASTTDGSNVPSLRAKNHVFGAPCSSTKFVKISSRSHKYFFLLTALSDDNKACTFIEYGRFLDNFNLAVNEDDVTDITSGKYFSLYLKKDGTVFKLGEYFKHVSDTNKLYQAAVSFPENASIVKISAGLYHAAFVTEEGQLFTTGVSRDGRLGVFSDEDVVEEPRFVTEGVKSVACGGDHTVAVMEDGTVICFGGGRGYEPTVVSGLDGLTVDQIASFSGKSLLLADSSLHTIPFPYHSEKPQKVTNLDGVKVHSIAAVHERLQAVFVQRTSLPPIDWVRALPKGEEPIIVTFAFKGGQNFRGIRNIIAYRCKALLGEDSDQNPVKVPESFGVEAFKRVLHFVTTRQLEKPEDLEEALGDWQVAHHYKIREVVSAFHRFAAERLDAKTPEGLVKSVLDYAATNNGRWPPYKGSVKWTHPGGEVISTVMLTVNVVDGETRFKDYVRMGVWAHHSSNKLDEAINSIAIPDTSKNTFTVVNKFMHSSNGKIDDPLNFKESIDVYKFAELYGFESLKTAVYPHLQTSMQVGDVPKLFVLSETRDDMKEIFWRFAVRNKDVLLEDEEAMAAVTSNLDMFLGIAAKKLSGD